MQDGSPAADAGLKAGDVVTAVDDRPVTTSTELTAAVRSAEPGDKVTLTVAARRRQPDASRSRSARPAEPTAGAPRSGLRVAARSLGSVRCRHPARPSRSPARSTTRSGPATSRA